MLVPWRCWPRQTYADPLELRFIIDNQYSGRQPPSCSSVPCSPSREQRESSDQKPGSIHPKVFLVRRRSKALIAPAASRKHPPAGECWILCVSAWLVPRCLNRRRFVFTIAILPETADWFNTALCPLRKAETTLVLLYSGLGRRFTFKARAEVRSSWQGGI
jgi:hypothetical protein